MSMTEKPRKNKLLYNRVGKIYSEMVRLRGEGNLQLQSQTQETRDLFTEATEKMLKFMQNIS